MRFHSAVMAGAVLVATLVHNAKMAVAEERKPQRLVEANSAMTKCLKNVQLRDIPGQNIEKSQFQGTIHDCMGISFEDYSYLKKKGFSNQQIILAERDNMAIGFDADDRRGLVDNATIEKNDNNPEATIQAMVRFKTLVDNDPELNRLLKEKDATHSGSEQLAIDKKIEKAYRRLKKQYPQ